MSKVVTLVKQIKFLDSLKLILMNHYDNHGTLLLTLCALYFGLLFLQTSFLNYPAHTNSYLSLFHLQFLLFFCSFFNQMFHSDFWCGDHPTQLIRKLFWLLFQNLLGIKCQADFMSCFSYYSSLVLTCVIVRLRM